MRNFSLKIILDFFTKSKKLQKRKHNILLYAKYIRHFEIPDNNLKELKNISKFWINSFLAILV